MGDFCYGQPMLERIFRQAERMDRMMQRVGVNPATAARADRGTAWYEARTRCIACGNERQCRIRLEGALPSAVQPEFCPNAEFFRSCLSQILRHRGIVPTD